MSETVEVEPQKESKDVGLSCSVVDSLEENRANENTENAEIQQDTEQASQYPECGNGDGVQEQEHSLRPGLGERAKGRRFISGMARNWSSPHYELLVVQQRHGKHSWQAKALCIIHSHKFQQMLMIALLFDVLILFAEIFLTATYPPCFVIEKEAINCCPSHGEEANDHGDDGNGRMLFEAIRLLSGGEDICEYPLEPSPGQAGCDPHKSQAAHTAHKVLYALTLVILSMFFLELVILWIVLGTRHFFHNKLYVMDTIIVVASLALEITFGILAEEDLASLTGLLIIGRLWRFVRIGHGLFSTTMEVSLAKIEELEYQVEELKAMLDEASGAHVSDNAVATINKHHSHR